MNFLQIAEVTGRAELSLVQGPALVLAAQAGDEVFGCGGACRRHVDAGDSVTVLIVYDNFPNSQHISTKPIVMASDKRESDAASKIIGYPEPIQWIENKLQSRWEERLIRRVAQLITHSHPAVIYAPFFGDTDPRRSSLGIIAWQAARLAALGCPIIMYEVAAPLRPNRLLDITNILPIKQQAMSCFRSRMIGHSDLEIVLALNQIRTYSLAAEVKAAEGYWLVRGDEILHPISILGLDNTNGTLARILDPMVSIIIRTTNRVELDFALDSIAAQNYRNIEVILVDVDGLQAISPKTFCGQFPLRVISKGERLNRGEAANYGLDAARGDFVCFLDDDDWFLPEHIQLLVSALRRSENALAAYCNVECRTQLDTGEWKTLTIYNADHDPTRLLIENYLPMHAVLFDRHLVGEKLRFDESLVVYEDWDFWIQLSALTSFVHVDRVTAIYRISQYSGFGFRQRDPQALAGLSAMMKKWRDLWTVEQVVAIAGWPKYQLQLAAADAQRRDEAHLLTQASLTERIARLEALVAEREKLLSNQLAEENRLRLAQEERNQRVADLEAQLASHLAEADRLRLTQEERNQRVADLEAQLVPQLAEADRLRLALEGRNQRVADLEAQLAPQLAEADRLRLALEGRNQRVADLEAQLAEGQSLTFASAVDREGSFRSPLSSSAGKQSLSRERQYGLLADRLYAIQSSTSWQVMAGFYYAEQRMPLLIRNALVIPKIIWWSLTFKLFSRLRRRADFHSISASGLFDEAWYLKQYPDVPLKGFRANAHWWMIGWRECRDPNPLFHTKWYLERYKDVIDPQKDPLLSYIERGICAGHDPCPLFDSMWYLENNTDLDKLGINPLMHYLRTGWREGRDPHPFFATDWYLERNPEAAQAGINPLVHYLKSGWKEGRNPHPLFSAHWYLKRNTDIAQAGINPFVHYVYTGWREGRDPHPLFVTAWYLKRNPDVARAEINPLLHYLNTGWREGRDPHPLFATAWYLERNPDAARAEINPLLHYLDTHWREGRDPHPLFATAWYLERNPDVARAEINPLLHYLDTGWREGRDPHPLFATTWYLEKNPEVAGAGINPLVHYIIQGGIAGFSPHPLFDSNWYRDNNPDILDINPLIHFVTTGGIEGRDPHPNFDSSYYLKHYPEVGDKGINPLVDYLARCAREGRAAVYLTLDPATCVFSTTPPPSPQCQDLIPHWCGDWTVLPQGSGSDTGRILVIDWKAPTPDRDSGSYRMRMILEILATAEPGRIDFIGDCLAESHIYTDSLTDLGIQVIVGESAALTHLMSHGGEYRAAWISRPEITERYLPMVRAFAGRARVFYDTVDLHWVRFTRASQFGENPKELEAVADRYHRLELANARAADVTIAITQEERAILMEQDPKLVVTVVPNVHPLYPCLTQVADRRDLFFIGGFNHAPNVDAVHYFITDILPLVHQFFPEVRFHIVGSNMPESIRELASPLIDPVGYVPDVEPWFEQSRVFVAPLRHGAGMKGKVGQSLSYGLPVVTSSVGAEGISLFDGVNALIADEPVLFAEAIRRLYSDDALWKRISEAGQELIRERFSKEKVAPILQTLVA
jgi:ubiquinone biosynthesis protein Coq4/LmbE family N-acetylglucosaminyl deacetylase